MTKFKVACELENKTNAEVTVHLSIPQAAEPSVIVLKPKELVSVFAGPDGSAPKITIAKATGGE